MTGLYHLRPDTLAGLKTSALFLPRSMADQPVSLAINRLNAYMNNQSGVADPEGEAFKFYFANHAFSVIASKFDQHEILPAGVAEVGRNYVKLGSDLVVRLAYYCLLITVREARHLHDALSLQQSLTEKCGAEAAKFVKSICGHGEDGAVGKLRKNPPNTTLGQLVRAIERVFGEGGFSGGYGGEPWRVVADTLLKLVEGKITPEMFADTAFTLAHNNGPIFNKGMLYSGYDHFLYKLLDVQRSGQIPQLYEELGSHKKILTAETVDFITQARRVFPSDMTGNVDWFKVEALGALRRYPKEKEEQVKKHGMSNFATVNEKKLLAEQAKTAALEKKKFYIAPNEFVTMVERAA